MILIDANPIQNPDAAENKLAALWEFTMGRRFCLMLVGAYREPVHLGVLAPDSGTEQQVSELVASLCRNDQGDANVEESLWLQTFKASPDSAIINMHWTARKMVLEDKEWWGQRFDPLSNVYAALSDLPPGVLGAAVISLRSLPSMQFRASMYAIASSSGFDASEDLAYSTAWKIASAYGGIGVKMRRPLFQKRAIRRALALRFRFPFSLLPVNVVSRFWHPPLFDRTTGMPPR